MSDQPQAPAPEKAITPQEALHVLDQVTAGLQLNRATHVHVLKCIEVLRKLSAPAPVAAVPPAK